MGFKTRGGIKHTAPDPREELMYADEAPVSPLDYVDNTQGSHIPHHPSTHIAEPDDWLRTEPITLEAEARTVEVDGLRKVSEFSKEELATVAVMQDPRLKLFDFKEDYSNPYPEFTDDPVIARLHKQWRMAELKHSYQLELERVEAAEKKTREWEDKNKILFFGDPEKQYLGKYGKWGPNPAQDLALKAFKEHPELIKILTYLGANRIGKCISISTKVSTIEGELTVEELLSRGTSFYVWAWDELSRKLVPALASAPFKKEIQYQCYRVLMSDGRWIEAADEHRILTKTGWRFVKDIYDESLQRPSVSPSPLLSNLGIALVALVPSVLRLFGKRLGYLGGCFAGFRRCGGRLLSCLRNVLTSSPLQVDVQLHDAASSHLDGRGYKHTNTRLLKFSHLSILGDLLRFSGLFGAFLARTFSPFWSRCFARSLVSRLFSNAVALLRRVFVSHLVPPAISSYPYFPPLVGDNRIISIEPIGVKDCYDFSVEGLHNYLAGGVINHNSSLTTGILALSFCIGHYPWEDPEKAGKWVHKALGWKSGTIRGRIVGQDWEKHIKAVLIPTIKEFWPESFGVTPKKNNTGVDAYWTFPDGSTVEIMSNNSESAVFEGAGLHFCIYDEPPKRDVRVACARGLVDNNGVEVFAMTLLKEAWVSKEVVNLLDEEGNPDPSVFNIHADIYCNEGFGISREGINQFMKVLTPDEISARIRGIPAYMSGLVLKLDRKTHYIDAFDVPSHWPVDVAIDIGVAKPHDILFRAISERGFCYVIHAAEVRGDGTAIADYIIKFGSRYNLRINRVIVDPLAKSDRNNENSTYEKIDIHLNRFDLYLETGSKQKEDGILNINNALESTFGSPSLYFFRNASPKMFRQLENLVYEDNGSVSKEDDDAFENLYRLMLLDTRYEEPLDEDEEREYAASLKSADSGRNRVTGY